MATFTLTDLRNEVTKKYAPTIIENGDDKYILQNLMQMEERKRRAIEQLVDSIQDEPEAGEDGSDAENQTEVFRQILVAAEDNDRGEELLELLGDNLAMLVELVNSWMEGTQLGEASQS